MRRWEKRVIGVSLEAIKSNELDDEECLNYNVKYSKNKK